MNPATLPSSMFLHRLKTEFSENLKLTIALWLILGVFFWSFYRWWFGPIASESDATDMMSGLSIFGVGATILFLIGTMFKRDDLKNPQDFWTTRPIRSFTLFGTKLVYVWLIVVIPAGILMMILGWIAGAGTMAFWHGVETILWLGFLTNLLALSGMSHLGGNKALLGLISFFGGVILACVLLSNPPAHDYVDPYVLGGAQLQWNIFVLLLVLNAWLAWKLHRQISHPHLSQRATAMLLTGFLVVITAAFAPIPGGLPGTSLGQGTQLPVASHAQFNKYAAGYGELYGAKFVSLGIELAPDTAIMGSEFDVRQAHVEILGAHSSGHLLDVETAQYRLIRNNDNDLLELRPGLGLFIYTNVPGSSGRSSNGTSPEIMTKLSAIPQVKVRLKGNLMIDRYSYRTLQSSSLDRPISHRDGNIRCSFQPTPSDSRQWQSIASWKRYAPTPLMLGSQMSRLESIRCRIEHPTFDTGAWSHRFEGSGQGGGGLFGQYYIKELRMSDEEIEASYDWSELVKSGYPKSVQDWKKDARLVFEEISHVEQLILPIDAEVEIPDPDRVREMLRNGEL